MSQIRLILDSPNGSIGYRVDLDSMRYESGHFDKQGVLTDPEESGEITDKNLLAKRLYLIIKAALSNPQVPQEPPEVLEAAEEEVG